MIEPADVSRRARDAATRLSGTVQCIRSLASGGAGHRWLAGYEAGQLLWKVLLDAGTLVELLNEDDDQAEYIERMAKGLHAALRNRRLAAALSRTEGRTEAEATEFERKAGELRG